MAWVKICGITNIEDAQKADRLGADALGFIFAPSPRKVEVENARRIIDNLGEKVEKIGVFLDHDIGEVKRIAEKCGLTGIQFHGSESPEYLQNFEFYTIIKSIRVNRERGWDEIEKYREVADRLLLDTYVDGKPGGTGNCFPWELIREYDFGGVPVIVAGGITPDNVLDALGSAPLYGIDVCSGVEEVPGKKSKVKLKRIFEKIGLGG